MRYTSYPASALRHKRRKAIAAKLLSGRLVQVRGHTKAAQEKNLLQSSLKSQGSPRRFAASEFYFS